MKRLICLYLALALAATSCDTDCNDCGPTGYTRYYLKNTLSEDLHLTWFQSSGIVEEIVVSAQTRVVLFEASKSITNATGTLGEITKRPFGSIAPYDSVRVRLGSGTITYLEGLCEQAGNLLCEENYEVIKSIDNKSQRIKEWEFTF